MADQSAVVLRPQAGRFLTREEFTTLASAPPEAEWFANIENPNTRRAYRSDLRQFMGFVGIAHPLCAVWFQFD